MPAKTKVESVLLIGGCGFLGLHLIDAFWKLESRPRIHVFDIRPLPDAIPKAFYSFDPAAIKVHIGDIASEEDVARAIKESGASVIVHSASPIHGMGEEIYYKVNVEGTRNVIDCARKAGVGALVYTSSAGVIFNGEDLYGADESTPFPKQAMDAYNKTKQEGEVMVLKANDKKLKTVAIRPAGIFGPGDRQMFPALRLVGQRGQHRFQLGDNQNLFDVTYVANVAYSHVLAAEKLLGGDADKVGGEAFLITNDAPIYFWSVARALWAADGLDPQPKVVLSKGTALAIGYVSELISKLLGKEPTLTPFRVKTACATRYYNITKAKTVLGYKPVVPLEEGIRLTIASMNDSSAAKN